MVLYTIASVVSLWMKLHVVSSTDITTQMYVWCLYYAAYRVYNACIYHELYIAWCYGWIYAAAGYSVQLIHWFIANLN